MDDGTRWQLVPEEPTEAMLRAADALHKQYGALTRADAYRAMLLAAPSPPPPQADTAGLRAARP